MNISNEDLIRINEGFGGNLRSGSSIDFAFHMLEKKKLGLYKKLAFLFRAILVDHPFSDGNGRTSRLLMNLLLMQEGYPPAIIRKEDRLAYINSLEKAQKGGGLDDFYNLIYGAVDGSLNIYLEALEPESQRFYTTDEVAKLLQVDPESVRRWVRKGNLRAAKLGGKFIRIDKADLDRFIEQLKT